MNTNNMKTTQTLLARSVKTLSAGGVLLALGMSTSTMAAEVACGAATNINADAAVNCFAPNSVAKANEVNANFERLLARIRVLEAKLEAVTYDARTNNLRITGANLQIVNGDGYDEDPTANGKGNLIIGYNRMRTRTVTTPVGSLELPGGRYVCSDGSGNTEATCTGTWGRGQRTGSHNLVIGNYNQYTQFNGIVAGIDNAIVAEGASVLGGSRNTASGLYSFVSAGFSNEASGDNSSVIGGNRSIASGVQASVSGGSGNQASAYAASVSGGDDNTASGNYSSVSGGYHNVASGVNASISGGERNTASGVNSSVYGGTGRTASGRNQYLP